MNRFQRDGKEYPYQGPLGDKISVKTIDARTSESVVTAKGKPEKAEAWALKNARKIHK